jgi:hypothetical protein
MAKKKVIYSETYVKGVVAVKEKVIDLINSKNSEVFAVKMGKYDDGRDFLTVTIEVDGT